MNAGTGTGPFRSAYASALLDYLLEPSETSLRVAYELAREAVSRGSACSSWPTPTSRR